MKIKVAGAVTVVFLQLLTALAVLPVFTENSTATIGTTTTFSNGNSVQDFDFPEKGEDWSLAFRLPANSTVMNATFKVTGSFLGGSVHVDHTNDTSQGWGGESIYQPDYNNTTSVDQGNSIELYKSQLGPLSARVGNAAGSNPTGVAVGDINDDTYNEVVVCNYGNSNISVYTTGTDGALTHSATYSTSSKPWDVTIGDVSNDGLKDVVVSCGDSSTCYVDVLTQKTDGTLNSKASYQASSSSSKAYFVDIGDVDSDDLPDVVTTDYSGQYVKVFIQNSGGTLNSATSVSADDYVTGVAIGDFLSNSGNEVAIYFEPYMSWYYIPSVRTYKQSSGSLTTDSTYNMVSWAYNYGLPFPIEIGEISGDGREDIVVGWKDYYNYYLSVFCQTSSGLLASRVDYTNGVTSPRHLDIGDINSDGKNEVVLVNDGNNNVVVYNQTSNGRLNNLKSYTTGKKPTGVAIGDVNRDGRNDVVTADYTDGEVGVHLQPKWFNGSFTSRALTAPKPNEYAGIQNARPYWNITSNGESYAVWLSNDDGKSWTNVTSAKGQWLNFTTKGSQLKYRVYMNSSRFWASPKINDISLDYRYGTDPKGIYIDITNDEVPEYDRADFLNGSEWLNDFSQTLNQYIAEHQGDKDNYGYILVPIYIRCGGMGKLTFSNITLKYNRPPFGPVLLGPLQGEYTSSVPAFKMACHDPDNDTVLYLVQISLTRDFAKPARTLDMRVSKDGWSKANYSSDEVAVYQTPANLMYPSGTSYYWRAITFDGVTQSDWSPIWNFSIDSEAPEVAAKSPPYSTGNEFEVSWEGSDPAPGSGLIANPYEVQYKVDDGNWTDWKVRTGETRATYTGEPGHIYYFRARATDVAGNRKIYAGGNGDTSTIIDPNAPVSGVKALPEYVTGVKFTVEWSGTDGQGGSGIAGYDVQVRDGAGAWTDWLGGVAGTSAEYDGVQGHTYYFQSRARDRAGNLEEYPGEVGDAHTKVDVTPPAGSVADDGSESPSAISLHVRLEFTDAESGVAGYEYRVGTTKGGSEIAKATPAAGSDLTIGGLNLSVGPVYYVDARARNGAGLWSPWASSDGITVSAGSNVASVVYTNGAQTGTTVHVQLGGEAPGAKIVDGDLEVRKATYYRGELGTWGNWMEVGGPNGDLNGADYVGDPGYAYEFRYRIKSDFGLWSNYSQPGYYVHINAQPVAVAGTDQSTEVGKGVSLDGTKSWDPDGDAIASYRWDFGDGLNDTKAATSHSYGKAGKFRVTLTVSDGNLTDVKALWVTVREKPGGATPGLEGVYALVVIGAVLVLDLWRRRR